MADSEKRELNATATYSLNEDTIHRLALAQFLLGKITGKRGHDMSKSRIVDTALQIIIDDLEKNEENSLIAQMWDEING